MSGVMKDIILKLCRWMLGILGFSAVGCDIRNVSTAEEYGVPHADFEVKGMVSDGKTGPVQGIRISVSEAGGAYSTSSTMTDESGSYALTGSFFPSETIEIKVEDIDGEENGGVFESQTRTVTLERKNEGEGWYGGLFSAEGVDFVLTESAVRAVDNDRSSQGSK